MGLLQELSRLASSLLLFLLPSSAAHLTMFHERSTKSCQFNCNSTSLMYILSYIFDCFGEGHSIKHQVLFLHFELKTETFLTLSEFAFPSLSKSLWLWYFNGCLLAVAAVSKIQLLGLLVNSEQLTKATVPRDRACPNQLKLLSTSERESQAQIMHLCQLLARLIECPCHHLWLGSLALWQCSTENTPGRAAMCWKLKTPAAHTWKIGFLIINFTSETLGRETVCSALPPPCTSLLSPEGQTPATPASYSSVLIHIWWASLKLNCGNTSAFWHPFWSAI